jgi:hypothetical protein
LLITCSLTSNTIVNEYALAVLLLDLREKPVRLDDDLNNEEEPD